MPSKPRPKSGNADRADRADRIVSQKSRLEDRSALHFRTGSREPIRRQGFVTKLEAGMAIKGLSTNLACERAWQVYCLMNPSAQRQIKLKARLDSYLSALPAVDSNRLTVDGLKYLKRLEARDAVKVGQHR